MRWGKPVGVAVAVFGVTATGLWIMKPAPQPAATAKAVPHAAPPVIARPAEPAAVPAALARPPEPVTTAAIPAAAPAPAPAAAPQAAPKAQAAAGDPCARDPISCLIVQGARKRDQQADPLTTASIVKPVIKPLAVVPKVPAKAEAGKVDPAKPATGKPAPDAKKPN